MCIHLLLSIKITGYEGSHRVNDLYAFCFLSRKWTYVSTYRGSCMGIVWMDGGIRVRRIVWMNPRVHHPSDGRDGGYCCHTHTIKIFTTLLPHTHIKILTTQLKYQPPPPRPGVSPAALPSGPPHRSRAPPLALRLWRLRREQVRGGGNMWMVV